MPRVAIKRKDYVIKDFSAWVVGKMYIKNLTQKDMADLFGITQPAFCMRLKNGAFSYAELLVLLKQLEATDDEILKFMKL